MEAYSPGPKRRWRRLAFSLSSLQFLKPACTDELFFNATRSPICAPESRQVPQPRRLLSHRQYFYEAPVCIRGSLAKPPAPIAKSKRLLSSRDVTHPEVSIVPSEAPILHGRRPRNYWESFEHLRFEIIRFLKEKNLSADFLPSDAMLRAYGQASLGPAIRKHGGSFLVAQRMGMRVKGASEMKRLRIGDLQRELLEFMKEIDTSYMPSFKVLRTHNKHDLAAKILRRGGCRRVAFMLGIPLPEQNEPRGYWARFENLAQEMHEYLEASNKDGTGPGEGNFPCRKHLEAAGREDLCRAIARHGGYKVVAEKMKLRVLKDREENYARLQLRFLESLRDYITTHGTPGCMPSEAELRAAGHYNLTYSIAKMGGYTALAARLGLVLKRKGIAEDELLWGEFDLDVGIQVLRFAAQHGMGNNMPEPHLLRQHGREDLETSILDFGGFESVGRRLGLGCSDAWTNTSRSGGAEKGPSSRGRRVSVSRALEQWTDDDFFKYFESSILGKDAVLPLHWATRTLRALRSRRPRPSLVNTPEPASKATSSAAETDPRPQTPDHPLYYQPISRRTIFSRHW